MLTLKIKSKYFIKFINIIKLITLWVFVLFNLYLFKSCVSKNEPNQDLVVDRDGNGLIEIYTIEDLNKIRFELNGVIFKNSETDPGNRRGCPINVCKGHELKADLDFNTGGEGGLPTRWSSNYVGADKVADGWLPIGDIKNPYRATFNGNGFQVKNLYIKSNSLAYAGLFGLVNTYSGEIKNIGVTNFWINIKYFSRNSAMASSGGLVGTWNGKGGISNSFATGYSYSYSSSAAATANSFSGGLVGDMWYGGISNCYATGSSFSTSISSSSDSNHSFYSYSGGLVGSTMWISNSFATGTSNSSSYSTSNSSTYSFSGGLVGSSGEISNSYAIGWSSSTTSSADNNPTHSYSGGLVGRSRSITNSYSTGSSTSSSTSFDYVDSTTSNSGGLAGYIADGGNIYTSYATSSSFSSSNYSKSFSGGLVGYMENVSIINSYATGSSFSTNLTGGLVGRMIQGSITNSFWNNESDQIINNVYRSNASKLGIGNNNSSNIASSGLTPLTVSQLQATSGSILGLGFTAFDFIGNGNYPKLCVNKLRAGRTTCTTADYIENVLSEIVFLK